MTERQIGQGCPNSSIRLLQLIQHAACLQGMKTHVVVRVKRQTAHLLSILLFEVLKSRVCMLTESSVHAHRVECACSQSRVCMLTESSVHAHRVECACSQSRVCMLTESSVHAHRVECACSQSRVCMHTESSVHAHRVECACSQSRVCISFL